MAKWRRRRFQRHGRTVRLGPVCLNCHPPGSFDVYGMKSFPSVLDVKTDRIDRTVSAGKRIGNGPLVVNVGLY
jgi:hypothetical protein